MAEVYVYRSCMSNSIPISILVKACWHSLFPRSHAAALRQAVVAVAPDKLTYEMYEFIFSNNVDIEIQNVSKGFKRGEFACCICFFAQQ